MGRVEFVALSDEGESDRPARASAALQIEQTVIWAESRLISVRGELDLTGAAALQRLLAGTVGSGLPCIVLDLSTCRFLDTVALDVITKMQSELAANGQELMVQGATGATDE